jgi:hypothetical protein
MEKENPIIQEDPVLELVTRKPYEKPEIIVELKLEASANTSLPI